MKYTTIDGHLFKEMVISGAYELENNKAHVNSLNVFPVPDGDTGTNMSSTMMSAVNEINLLKDITIQSVADAAAMGSLMGARGNSGVILSQLLRGISKHLKNKRSLSTKELAAALKEGVITAYRAVMKPTEGTILTVARESADRAIEVSKQEDDFENFMNKLCNSAELSLNKTPELLPVLKQAGVVDAGGKGLFLIYLGMYKVLQGNSTILKNLQATEDKSEETSLPKANIEVGEIKFGYCTEFFIKTANANPDEFKEKIFKYGDSIVVAGTESLIKVHVHTNEPGTVLNLAQKLGELSKIKIDNMKEQHRNLMDQSSNGEESKEEDEESLAEYGIITVAAGEGIVGIFKDLGVNVVIEGGQTMNPSTQDILNATNSFNAKNIFILPNNSNIIMAAEQAREVSDKNLIVIPTKSIPQGITAAISFNPDLSPQDNEEVMIEAVSNVKTGQVTFAVRNTTFNDVEIKEGNILGILNGKLIKSGENVNSITKELIDSMITDDNQLITVLYGNGYSKADTSEIQEYISEKYSNCDISFNYGGQPLYYYIISVE